VFEVVVCRFDARRVARYRVEDDVKRESDA
jgi:hypothetical protein